MFTVFKKVLNKNSEFTQDDLDKVQEFVFCRWLSGNPALIDVANTLNYYRMPKNIQLKFAQCVINSKVKFIPYPKAETSKLNEYVPLVCKYFNISEPKAKMYLEFLKDQDLKFLKEYYR